MCPAVTLRLWPRAKFGAEIRQLMDELLQKMQSSVRWR
jgi:hypothetical protein